MEKAAGVKDCLTILSGLGYLRENLGVPPEATEGWGSAWSLPSATATWHQQPATVLGVAWRTAEIAVHKPQGLIRSFKVICKAGTWVGQGTFKQGHELWLKCR